VIRLASDRCDVQRSGRHLRAIADRDPVDDPLTDAVIGAFYEVYNILGFGLLESAYAAALTYELRTRGHRMDRELTAVVQYKGVPIAKQRIDMLVDRTLVVETKATAELHPSAKRQLYSYLRATGLPVGLVLHFGLEPRAYRVWCQRGKEK
jgi:GxxExxY protein